MPAENKPRHRLYLLASVLSAAQRRVRLRRFTHCRITIRVSISLKVEGPNIEACLTESVAPGVAVEAMRDRERRGKGRPVNIENRLYVIVPLGRRQMTQKQPHAAVRAFNPVMLLAWIEMLSVCVNRRHLIRLTPR